MNCSQGQDHPQSSQKFERIFGEYTVYFSQVIGEGTYSKVYKASKSGSEEVYACKLIKQKIIDNLQIYQDKKIAQQLEDRLHRQGEFQKTLSECPYITKMYHTQKNQNGFYFFMEYCETDLSKLLKKKGFFQQQIALKYFRQIIEGVKHIYQKNAFHRDLKPENLLLKNGTIKISDFGFVKIFKARENMLKTQSLVGTFRYMSPQILHLFQEQGQQTSKYNPEKSDVWSLGIILYKMLFGKQPFDCKSYQEMIKKIIETELVFPQAIEFPPGNIVKTNISKDVIGLMRSMLNPDENERISLMGLYSKFNSLLQENQEQKRQNTKQNLLNIYNKAIIRLYKDLSNFATLREIGIENYSQFSYKIMTLIHEKRISYLETQNSSEVGESISQYHNIFYQSVKSLANLQQDDTLQSLLLVVHKRLQNYDDFNLLIKQVQLFLLSLLQLYCLQLGLIDEDCVCDVEDKIEKLKSESIVELKSEFARKISVKIK